MGTTSHLRLMSPTSPRPQSSALLVRRLPRGQRKSVVLSSSAVLLREVKMFAIATLLVSSVTAQAAKYDYGSYESAYYGGDAYSGEPSYTYESRPTYSHELRYKRSIGSPQDEAEVREPQAIVVVGRSPDREGMQNFINQFKDPCNCWRRGGTPLGPCDFINQFGDCCDCWKR